MQMPGFTAEAALYPSGYRYETAGALGAPSTTAEVVPQACVNIGPCRVCVTVRVFPFPRACLTQLSQFGTSEAGKPFIFSDGRPQVSTTF
jgi:hypothetical protein